jgi:hypothetical protein
MDIENNNNTDIFQENVKGTDIDWNTKTLVDNELDTEIS